MRRLLHALIAAGCALLPLNGASASAQIIGGEWIADHTWHAAFPDAQFGASIAAVGDIDGDGCFDFVVGAEFADSPQGDTGSAEVFSGKTGARIWLLLGEDYLDVFGASVAGPGDMDGDSIPDVVVGAPNYGFLYTSGAVYAFSSATQTRLWRMTGIANHDDYGRAVAPAGDLNGDGYADVLAGAPKGNRFGADDAGYVQAHHGLTGAVLMKLEGGATGDRFGESIASPGDLTSDGVPEILIGAPGADPGGRTDAGSIYLHSGANGALLHRWDGRAAGDGFGTRLAPAGDMNGDGFGDMLIGAPGADPGGKIDAGSALLFSVRTGEILAQWDGAAADDQLGLGLAGGVDLDGDSVLDLAIGAPGADPGGVMNAGEVSLYSGADGVLIDKTAGAGPLARAGAALALIPDTDGDGKPDWLVGMPGAISPTLFTMGAVHLRRHNSFLRLAKEEISVSSGGVVTMDLDFPPDAAFHEFAILVSRTGTGPTQLGALTVPLTSDALFVATLSGRLPTYLVGFRGVLSAASKAGAALAPAPGDLPASLIGATLYFAAVGRPAGGSPRISSSAASLTILP